MSSKKRNQINYLPHGMVTPVPAVGAHGRAIGIKLSTEKALTGARFTDSLLLQGKTDKKGEQTL